MTARPTTRRLRFAAPVLLLALATAACGGSDDEQVTIGVEQGGGGGEAALLALAERASAPLTETTTDRVTPDQVTLGTTAEYFQPAAAGSWTAPDECAFNTRLDVRVDGTSWPSPPFEGPEAPDDQRTSGFAGGVVPLEDGRSFVLVAGYAHHSTLSLTVDPSAAIDSQPADGWTALGLLVPDGEPVATVVTLDAEAADGTLTTTQLEVPPIADGGELAVLTPEWAFDLQAVGEQCEPPAEIDPPVDPMIEWEEPEPPTLSEPGEQPADPAAATAGVLESVRVVFDVVDAYTDEEQLAHLEDRPESEVVVREVREQQVIEPYRANLDPLFDSVVFTSPTTAEVLYRVGPSYSWEVGRVLLQGDTWRVALGTLCRDLADAIYTCPGVEQDPGPGPLG